MIAIVTLFISTVWCVTIPTVLGSLDCDINPDQYLTKGRAVTGDSFWESNTQDAVECARACIRRKPCTAFNFNSTSGICQLSTNGGQVVTTTRKDVAYSDIAHWPTQIDPHCYKRPCADDEICIPRGGDGSTCSHSCFKLARTCPLPAGSVPGQPRTVGSIFIHTCEDPRFVGGDSALCLASGEWNKTLDTSCIPLYGSSCEVAADCSPIQGKCDNNNNTCTCPDGHWYNEVTATCHPECGTDWIRFKDQCYYFGTSGLSFEMAWHHCTGVGSQIVYVESSDEIVFLKHEMGSRGGTYWNSLYQYADDGNELWGMTNGRREPTVTDWKPGEPNYDSELCTAMQQQLNHQWADVMCDRAYRPLCKKSA